MRTAKTRTGLLASWLLASMVSACSGGGGGSGETASSAGAITFAKSFGGPAREQATAALPRPDGGYVFAGTWSNRLAGAGRISGIDHEGTEGDFWVAALDVDGDIEWQRSYGRPSGLPAGERAASEKYYNAHAALDLDNDGQRDGLWLLGRLGGIVPGSTVGEYIETDSDLLITRLDTSNQVVWSRAYDSGAFPNYPFALGEEETSEVGPHFVGAEFLAPTLDGGAVAAVTARATVSVPRGGATRTEVAHAVYVVKVNAAGDLQWSTLLTYPEHQSEPSAPMVRALPNGGAVVAYNVRDADRLRVVRLDPSTGQSASVRWQRDFEEEGGETPVALLVVDDDVDGSPDGVLIASNDDSYSTFDGQEGIVRKLDDATGATLWRASLGTAVNSIDSTCTTPGVSCNYVVAGQDYGEVLVRALLRSSGATITERRFTGLRVPTEPALDIGGLRYLASQDRYQLLLVSEQTILLLDRSLQTVANASLVEPISPSHVAFDLNGGFVALESFLDSREDHLRFIDASGGISPPLALAPVERRSLERAYTIQPLASADRRRTTGFVVAGDSLRLQDFGGWRLSQHAAWVLRLDAQGEIVWQKQLEGFSLHTSSIHSFPLGADDAVRVLPDGAVVLGGADSEQFGRARLVKLDADGDLVWTRGGFAAGRSVRSLRLAGDGGFFAAGYAGVGDIAAESGSFDGTYVARLDADGAFQWGRRYSHLIATDLRPHDDGGVLIVGPSDGITDDDGISRPPSFAAVRVGPDGSVRWAKRYLFGRSRVLGHVRAAPAGRGWVLAATVADQLDPAGGGRNNVLLAAIDENGAVQWSQLYGGLYDEVVHAIERLADGGFLVSAQSDSMGDYTEAWVLRVGADGRINEGCNAALGRGGLVARTLDVVSEAYTPSSSDDPVSIVVIDTDVVANQPVDVVTARQCRGVATNDPGTIPNARTLTVNQAGSLTGVVTSLPQGIVCGTAGGGVCSATFGQGTLVTLRVDIGSVQDFQAWGAGCETVRGNFGEICDVRLDADRTIDVVFGTATAPPPPAGQFTLTVTIDRLGGFVGSTDGSFSCATSANFVPRTCAMQYPAGTVVNLYGAPLPGADVILRGWDGDCAGFSVPSASVTMNRDYTCRAVFRSNS